jgi:RHS repeat-associated protein
MIGLISCRGSVGDEATIARTRSALPAELPPDALDGVVVATEGHPGFLDGSLAVSHTGTAHYSIPISVPPGRGAMSPSLSLAYASEGPDGLFGVGWSLAGLSMVHRCPRDRAHDLATDGLDWTTSSPWCLDGQRREDVLDESNIIDWTTVGIEHHLRTRDGMKLVYGGVGGVWQGVPLGIPFGYALVRIEDRAGNTIVFTYSQSAEGQLRPQEIRYTGHASLAATRKVVFFYEARSRTVPQFIDGRRFSRDGRVSRLEMRVGSTKVAEYRFSYTDSPFGGRSLLSRVEHCDRGGVCERPLDLHYSGAFVSDPSYELGTGLSMSRADRLMNMRDMSGDGRDDLLLEKEVPIAPASSQHEILTLHDYPADGWRSVPTVDPEVRSDARITPFDFEGDGRGELIANWFDSPYWLTDGLRLDPVPDATGRIVRFQRSTTYLGLDALGGGETPMGMHGIADMDGDGVPELVQGTYAQQPDSTYLNFAYRHEPTADYGSYLPYMSLNPVALAGPHSVALADFDGDGRTELLLTDDVAGTYHETRGLDVTGSLEAPASMAVPFAPKQVFLDINGDGLTDIMELPPTGYGFVARFNTGSSFDPPSVAISNHAPWYMVDGGARGIRSMATGYTPSDVLVADLNLDGMQDFVLLAHDETPSSDCGWDAGADARMVLHISNGSTFDVALVRPLGNRSVRYEIGSDSDCDPDGWGHSAMVDLVESVHGIEAWGPDGLADVTYATSSGELAIASLFAEVPDRLVRVEGDLVPLAEIAYDALRWVDPAPGVLVDESYANDANLNYGASSGCSYPQRCVNEHRIVVSAHRSAIGELHLQPWRKHEYESAREDVRGYGFLGYERHDVRVEGISHTIHQTAFDLDRYPDAGEYPWVRQPKWELEIVSDPSDDLQWVTLKQYRYTYENGRTRPLDEVHRFYELDGSEFIFNGDAPPALDPNLQAVIRQVRLTYDWDTSGRTTSIVEEIDSRAFVDPGDSAETTTLEFIDFDARFPEEPFPRLVRRTSYIADTDESRSREIAYTYDDDALVETYRFKPGAPNEELVGTYTRNALGLVTASEELDVLTGEVRRTEFAYDDAGLWPQRIENALGHVSWELREPASGAVVFERDPNSVDERRRVDGFGRLRRESGMFGVVERDYVAQGGSRIEVRTTSDTEAELREQYDRFGRLTVRQSAIDFTAGPIIEEEFGYDEFGRLSDEDRAHFLEGDATDLRRYSYDPLDRIRRIEILDGGSPITFEYRGLTTTRVDREGHRADATADYRGRVVEVSRPAPEGPDALVSTFHYGPLGYLERVEDDAGSHWNYDRNTHGTLAGFEDPDAGDRSFVYNAFGEVVSEMGPEGEVREFERDLLGRPVTITSEDGATTFEWDVDAIGVLSSLRQDGGAEWEHHHDSFGRLTYSILDTEGGPYRLDYAYDSFSRLERITYPAVGATRLTIRNHYDGWGEVWKVTNDTTGEEYWRRLERDALGRTAVEQAGNGVVTTRTFDVTLGTIERMAAQKPGSPVLQDLAYERDRNGNLTRRARWEWSGASPPIVEAFAYDSLNQLLAWEVNESPREEYRYDRQGNLKFRSNGAGPDLEFGYGGTAGPHAVTSVDDGVAIRDFEYDARGRRTAGPGSFTAEYNSHDLPKLITGAGGTTELIYDGFGRRVAKNGPSGLTAYVAGLYEKRVEASGTSHVMHVYSPDREVAQIVVSGGSEQDFYLHHDALGSLDAVTNASGAVVDQFRFDPFGARTDEDGNPIAIASAYRRGFTGHEHDDDLGLIDMGARAYDPMSGRFLSPDPIVPDPLAPHGFNAYAYARNNPLLFTDPTGMEEECADASGSCSGTGPIGIFISLVACAWSGCGGGGSEGGASRSSHGSGYDEAYWDAYRARRRENAERSRRAMREAYSTVVDSVGAAANDVTNRIAQGALGWNWMISGSSGSASETPSRPWYHYIDTSHDGGWQRAADFGAGWGDAVSFGTTQLLRQGAAEITGHPDVVDSGSGFYQAGVVGGTLNAVGLTRGRGGRGAGTAREGPVRPGDRGTYGELSAQRRRAGQTEPLDMDHMPSFAAQRAAAEQALGRPLTPVEARRLRGSTPATASPRTVHRKTSPSYGGRNNPTRVAEDAADLEAAAARDRAVFDEAMRNR